MNLAGWDGAADGVPAHWTPNLAANSVTAEGFTAPKMDTGASTNILTTTINNFFSDDQITGGMKYAAGEEISDTENGVTLTGAESQGVKRTALSSFRSFR